MSIPETVDVETGSDPAGSVIWLHGLGADGHDFEPVVPELGLPGTLPLRFVFPHAPVRPVTINGGMAMRAWYDIVSLDRSGPADEQGIGASSEMLESLVEREIDRGVPQDRIMLAGFSQGGAIAINTIIRGNVRPAGLIALSTWLALPKALDPERIDPGLPIFMAHGRFDPMIPMQYGRASADKLVEMGFGIEWHDYPMAHAVCAEEIEDIRRFLVSVYGA
jgi:phospholipase/carboxylesterase